MAITVCVTFENAIDFEGRLKLLMTRGAHPPGWPKIGTETRELDPRDVPTALGKLMDLLIAVAGEAHEERRPRVTAVTVAVPTHDRRTT